MKQYFFIATFVMALTGVGVWALVTRVSPQEEVLRSGPNQGQSVAADGKTTVRRASSRLVASERPPKPQLLLSVGDEDDDEQTPEEKALAARIEKALDEEKVSDAIDCAREALVCKNVEIRQAMVDTLGWFGKAALPELTPFLADADEDVSESARNEWMMALSDIENEAERIGVIELSVDAIKNEDVLEEIFDEYIGMDEKLAVESLLVIIESKKSEAAIAKAKETYEFVTGEEFTDRAAAEKWIAEEYQPPEQEGE